MFRASYFRHIEDYIIHESLYAMFFMHLCKQSSRLEDVLAADRCNHVVSEQKNYVLLIKYVYVLKF